MLTLSEISIENANCPYGDALLENDDVIQCHDAYISSKKTTKKHTCPSTYYCKQLINMEVGICCPVQHATVERKCNTRCNILMSLFVKYRSYTKANKLC